MSHINTLTILFISVFLCFCDVEGCSNVCDFLSNFLCPGKSCRMNSDCTLHECFCDGTSTHADCVNSAVNSTTKISTTSNEQTTVTSSLNTTDVQSGCPVDFPCVHGHCNTTSSETNMFACVCENGFNGTACNESVCSIDPCTLNTCSPGQTCKQTENCSHTCVCDDGILSCSNSDTSSTLTTPTIPASPLEHSPCFDNFTSRSESERRCPNGMLCQYGYCAMDMSFGCHCDKGADGILCQHQCCRDCGQHGNCKYTSTLGEYCNCNSNYTGDRCEESIANSSDVTTATNNLNTTIVQSGCPVDFPCVHGYCITTGTENSKYACVCENGFNGTACNESVCDDGNLSCSNSNTSSTPSTTTMSVSPLEHNPCFANFTSRPESERRCLHGLCVYGQCVIGSSFGCQCDDGVDGILCQYPCCLDCGPKGNCKNTSDLGAYCNCKFNYTGDQCETLKTDNDTIYYMIEREADTWYLWVVGVCAVVLVVLIVILLVAPYLMWKNRVILVMKIVHYFQDYEDDDDREWDVFVSYKSTDRDELFVLHTLYPKLEQELGFRLNMHFRDFIPGETIANNIINAVKGSRRTLLVITPSYVNSEFTRFEYQVAQQEMLKRKHRIIPVLLDDITECKTFMDPNLKAILESVTYIEWPSDCSNQKKVDKFWKRMVLSLPKKRSETSKSSPADVASKGSPADFVAVDEIKLSELSSTVHQSNGTIYSNKAYFGEPEDDYDTINEDEIDKYRNFTNTIETNGNTMTHSNERSSELISTC